MNIRLAESLVQTLPVGCPGVFNPWREWCSLDDRSAGPDAGPDGRLRRLAEHLDCFPELILVGEAPGHLGCRYSGVPFTSERLVMDGVVPRLSRPRGRLTTRDVPFSEPSATIVWRTLYRLRLETKVVMWNALQLHPLDPASSHANRTPTSAEIALGRPALLHLLRAFRTARMVAVGPKAEALLRYCDINVIATVRHPEYGGAAEFAQDMSVL